MKIHITENIENIIEGYGMAPIIYGKVDLNKYPDNSLTEIIAIDALDSIPENLFNDFLKQVVNKMRIGCIAIFGGVELGLVVRNVINGKIDSAEFNHLVFNKKSIHSCADVVKLLQFLNLNIDNVNIRGSNYEIAFSRPANKN
jgi:hypothetical protein